MAIALKNPLLALHASGIQDIGSQPLTQVSDAARAASGEARGMVLGLQNQLKPDAQRVLDVFDGIRTTIGGALAPAKAPKVPAASSPAPTPLSPTTQGAVDKLPGPVADVTEVALESIKARPVLSAVGAGLGLLAIKKLMGS